MLEGVSLGAIRQIEPLAQAHSWLHSEFESGPLRPWGMGRERERATETLSVDREIERERE